VQRNISGEADFGAAIGALVPSRMHATLVLDRHPPDFSTDGGNSALIFKTKSPRHHVPFRT
jgi:hypothetical protein